jgi:predicted nucleotidyltransferase
MAAILAPDVQAVLDTFKRGLEEIYGPRLKGLILYGSRARGDARPDSDIDVVVVLDGPINRGRESDRISYLRAKINLDTELLVSCLLMTPERLTQIDSPLMLNLSREGVPV